MSIVLATREDKGKWNNIVEKDPQGTFFDRFEWCQILGKISDRIEALPIFLEEDGSIVGVFPSCLVKNGLSVTMESLPFTDYGGGPFYRSNEASKNLDLFKKVNNDLINIASKNRCLKISIRRLYYPNIINKKNINKPFFIDNNTCTFFISFTQGIDQVYREIKNSRRRSIRHGEKEGTIVREAHNLKDLFIFYKIYVENMCKLKSNPLPFEIYKNIWEVFAPNKEAKVFIAEYENEPIGGILLLNYKGVCYAWSGGTLYDYQDKRPMDVLIWHSIKWAFNNNYEIFDIGSTKNDPSSGHYFYKNSWGGKKKTLYNYHIILQPQKWRLYKLGNKLFNKFSHISNVIVQEINTK